MKKTIMIVAATLATLVASAQLNSKNGTPILPESGDWSIGINVNPFLDYVGHVMSNDGASSPSFDWTDGNEWVVTGKMMKDANTAYRVRARIGYGSTSENIATDVSFDSSYMAIDLGAGIQKYRGKGRLQGIYGAEAALGYGGSSDKTTNGAENKYGSTFSFGVRGFIGAEYFFAPKMSMGGEFNWGIAISSTGEDETTSGGTTTKSGGSSAFGIDADNVGGAISLNLYF